MKVPIRSTPASTACLTSLAVHLVVTIVLGLTTIILPSRLNVVQLALDTISVPDEELVAEAFVAASFTPEQIGAMSQLGQQSALAAALDVSDLSLVLFEPQLPSDFGQRLTVEVAAPVFEGPEFSDRLPVQGAGSVGTTGAMGAIDRITQEILTSVEQQPTLVAWLFDESGSLQGERAEILKRFRRVYEELGVINAAGHAAFEKYEQPLLTTVAGFGEQIQFYTPRPTDRIDEIETAVQAIGSSDSRYEYVFQAIGEVAQKMRVFRQRRDKLRNVMIVVFTDESGDDFGHHEATISLCRKLAISVYVVGRPAPFGREIAYVKWIDPDPVFDQRPQWVPVSLGPETLMPETLKLGFVGSRGNEELLDSGFGPYGLTKLCYETGGLYFAVHPNRVLGRRVSGYETTNLTAHITEFFDPEVMKRYQPDYISEREYRRQLSKNRARQALVEAAEISWAVPLDDFETRFPRRDEASLAAHLSRAQRAAAIRQPDLERMCNVLLEGEQDREKLRSPRWRAGYDLALGRALAARVRNEGYNAMLAQAKQGMPFTDSENNTWHLQSTHELPNSTLERLGKQATQLLHRVVEEHPGTPWAAHARRELKTPLGWGWQETYTHIPGAPQADENSAIPPDEPRPEPPPRRDPPPL